MQPQDQVWHSPLGSSNRTQQQQQPIKKDLSLTTTTLPVSPLQVSTNYKTVLSDNFASR